MLISSLRRMAALIASGLLLLNGVVAVAAEPIKLGFLYPYTGPYKEMGIAEARAALLAVEEINAAGGVLGRPLELLLENTASKPDKAVAAVKSVANQGASMVFGGVSSAVAITAGKEAAKQGLLFFSAHSYANATTGAEGHRYIFRESYNAWMSSKALSFYLNQSLAGKRLVYVTVDYSWGYSTEASMRSFTNTDDNHVNPGYLVPFPRPKHSEIKAALDAAQQSGAEVMVLTMAGDDLAVAMQLVHTMELKKTMTIIVPGLTLDTVRVTGVGLLEGVVSTVPWCWRLPYQYGFEKGIHFVDAFTERYENYPSSSAASTYSIVYQFKDAVERARSLNSERLIEALEDHTYIGLKDQQTWRGFDHQNVQSVHVVKVKTRNDAMKDRFYQDYFDILLSLPGNMAAQTQQEWTAARQAAGKPQQLQ